MSAGDEIMTAVTKPEAVAMAEIHALRQISDALSATNQSLLSLSQDVREVRGDMRDVRERVIRIEAEDLKAEVKALALRTDALEKVKDRQDGAMSVGGWVSKYAPWLVALVLAGLAGLGFKAGATP